MKLIADYVDRSIKFEHLAATEKNSAVKAQLERQSAAYRTLAERRAKEIGVPLPQKPEH
jgi:hypothetical protein